MNVYVDDRMFCWGSTTMSIIAGTPFVVSYQRLLTQQIIPAPYQHLDR